ncbi:AraC family transcriptional regulator [Erythrobacter sp.]|uniref:helix-turn-helix domain-containing protein n=1 Tax=Erythrobacter sp. TaxID=1042 RepID=UPI001B163E8A|nr:helix-turn-helix domain-containing protein [Erythrobacter sp.]MBO6527218.1 AraC family transcriptional regulator [Erythrobacter sp.]MBO6531036.1 AraC family transcriptional regulator [Erythrobacter sp.]
MQKSSLEVTDYESGGLKLRLIGPPPDLAPYLSAYYRTEIADGVIVEDWLPPEEGNLRTGRAEVYEAAIGNDPVVRVVPSVISGPTDRVTYLRIGGGKFWGIGLTPAGWVRFIGTPASHMTNRFGDIGGSADLEPLQTMLDQLRDDGDDVERAATLINTTFRALLGERPEVDKTVRAVHLDFLSEDASSVAPIASGAGMNPRTFERFCKRHFGFPPRTLLKRQRFLRSLGQYMLDPSMRWIGSLDTHYWDQAHFIRDFRATMGMTPSEFASRPHPIITAAVSVTNAKAGVTMQALYHPARAGDSETGL